MHSLSANQSSSPTRANHGSGSTAVFLPALVPPAHIPRARTPTPIQTPIAPTPTPMQTATLVSSIANGTDSHPKTKAEILREYRLSIGELSLDSIQR